MPENPSFVRTHTPVLALRLFAALAKFLFGALVAVVVIALVIGVVLAAWLGSYVLYYKVFPAYSADMQIEDLRATVRLEFYATEDDGKEVSRFVTIETPYGAARHSMCGYDWAHWARTGVYRTEDDKIAVLGRGGCDYLFSLQPLGDVDAANADSARWTYLGAFDFVGYPRGGANSRTLRFIAAADQAECIEMATQDFKVTPRRPRNEVRRTRCPHPDQRLSEPGR